VRPAIDKAAFCSYLPFLAHCLECVLSLDQKRLPAGRVRQLQVIHELRSGMPASLPL
jgi:hypothetical protein